MKEDFFSSTSVLARHLHHFEPRPGQGEMAAAVAEVLQPTETGELPEETRCLVIEAETGLGKTLAYLIPAALSGHKVVVSTNTRNLQDQILQQEIPIIRQHIVPDLEAVCVKGRQNYLCLYRYHQALAAGQQELFQGSWKKRLAGWLSRTRFGDRAELDWLPAHSLLWNQICCQSHFCPGNDCPHIHDCFFNKLRRAAAKARLLIVNHHLLFSDLAVRRGGYGEVLPRYQAVIFDEAHHIEDVATTFFGFSFSRYQVIDLSADLERAALVELAGDPGKELLSLVTTLSGALNRFIDQLPATRERFSLIEALDSNPDGIKDGTLLQTALERTADFLEDLPADVPWSQYSQRCHQLSDTLGRLITPLDRELPDEENRYVYWGNRTRRNLTLSATPIDIADDLHQSLFPVVQAVVFTSATLTAHGDFHYFLQRIGLTSKTPCFSFSSPFPYKEHTLCYIVEDSFPEPAAPDYRQACHERLQQLLQLARGRSLLLFTSLTAMQAAAKALANLVDYPLLVQGDAPRQKLVETFRKETDSVLLGVASFWEGVDIPGQSLSMVVIDKLPFEVPSDPVMMARINRIRAEGENPFMAFQVPRAIITLRQGVGRLMRCSRDRGVIALLDVRLFSKRYGSLFRRSLPPSPITRNLQDVARFLDEQARCSGS